MLALMAGAPAPVESSPLEPRDVLRPALGPGDALVRLAVCAVCHTDLHVVEGDLPSAKLPITPGHQGVGIVDAVGPGVTEVRVGDRVGAAWLRWACGVCRFCRRGLENLCERPRFNGYTDDGGYAEYLAAPAAFLHHIPEGLSDEQAAPLLCAGAVGYRALRLSEAQPGDRLGLYGFGASAHLVMQIARQQGCEVYVFTRSEEHRQLARDLGAIWAGGADEDPPPEIDVGIVFAPAGWIVPLALKALRPGGTLALAGIHMSPIPEMDYQLIYRERTLRSVANLTRQDAREVLALGAEIPIHSEVTMYPLSEANRALQALKFGAINGAAVLVVEGVPVAAS